MSKIQPFTTTGERLIKPGFGDSSTLAALYAFGLGDNPFVDNMFAMPDGNLRFPGDLTWGLHRYGAAVTFWGNRAAVSSSPPAYQLISLADTHDSGGGPGAFFILEDNDPAWNGLFSSLATAWTAESVTYSNSTDQTASHDATQFGRRAYNPYGASPINYPNNARPGLSMIAEMALFNSSAGDVEITERLTGYGQYEVQLYNIEPGACGQWITHWNNHAIAPAAGDGPAWLIDVDGRFNTFTMGAGLQAYSRGADPQNSAWGWKLLGRNNALDVVDLLDVTSDKAIVNGVPFAAPAATVVSFLSDEIDGSVVGVTPFGGTMPVLPGYKMIVVSGKVIFTDLHATAFSTNGVMSLGQNATFDDLVQWANSPNAAQMEAFRVDGGGGPYTSINGATSPFFTAGTGKIPDMGVMPSVNIKTAPTGTAITALKLRVLLLGVVSAELPNVP